MCEKKVDWIVDQVGTRLKDCLFYPLGHDPVYITNSDFDEILFPEEFFFGCFNHNPFQKASNKQSYWATRQIQELESSRMSIDETFKEVTGSIWKFGHIKW